MAQQASQKAAALAAESLSTPASRAAFSAASGSFAGMVSAITGLGGAVVFVPALSRLGFKAKDIVGTTVAAVTGATAAGSLAYAQKGVTGTLILIYPSSLSVTVESDIDKDSYIYIYICIYIMAAYILHTLTHIFSILSMYERNNRLTVCGDDWFCRRGVHADWTKVCAAHIRTDDATDAGRRFNLMRSISVDKEKNRRRLRTDERGDC